VQVKYIYSHLNGHEWILVHQPALWREVQDIVAEVDADQYKNKLSKERGRQGSYLYSPIELNEALKAEFSRRCWHEERTNYWVTDDAQLIRQTMHLGPEQQKNEIQDAGHEAIYSYNQTDFVKERIAVEVQFGKYAFIPFDLFVKHLAFYIGDTIDVGLEIVPTKRMQRQMSSGPGYYEGALYDLVRQGRGSPPVPLVLIGVEP
jgi:Txe/YoeB family toxin of Txe-Axe toxin-antitoxin module